MIPDAVAQHYQHVQHLQVLTLAAARRTWARVDPDRISESWFAATTILGPVVQGAQLQAATSGAWSIGLALAEQDSPVVPEALVEPRAFAGTAADGRSLVGLLHSPATTAKSAIAEGLPVEVALNVGLGALERIVRTTVSDAGRAASGVAVVARPGVGYTRMVNPPSCARCAILAGRFYRWNAGFARHPGCDCVHVPTTARSLDAAKAEGLVTDPRTYFDSLSEREQDRIFTKAGAQAIRDGADMSQVVNARRGMTSAGITTEGTTRRGFAASRLGGSTRRLTPESIYRLSSSRDQALTLLERNGYITPGPLRGPDYEGFGALGRGGRRVGARQAVLDARASGVRNPTTRATMTEAERRAFDAELRALAGGGGRVPPLRPPAPGVGGADDEPTWTGPHPEPEARPEHRAYWKRRQDALGIQTHGDTLKPREILFVERMHAIGHDVEWIPLDRRRRSTNDFVWLTHGGLVTELKSTGAGLDTIERAVRTAVTDARKFGVVKENFVIDLGSAEFPDGLLEALTGYNTRWTRSTISRLWVMADGALREVHLTK